MTTKKEREGLRALCDAAAPGMWEVGREFEIMSAANSLGIMRNRAHAELIVAMQNAFPALLDDLDKADKLMDRMMSVIHRQSNFLNSCGAARKIDNTCADRNRQKKRAQALERAIRQHAASAEGECFTCYSCIRRDKRDCWKECGVGHLNWKFDEARFAEGDE